MTELALHTDVRRHVAFVSQGAMRVLVIVQALLQDVDGALAAGQWEMAALAARMLVQNCLAIRGMARGGELVWTLDGVTFDCFAFATRDEVREATDLMDAGARLGPGAPAGPWRDRLERMVDQVQCELGFPEGLPVLRSPEGMFGAIRMTRGLFELVDRLGPPPVLPDDWIEATRSAAGGPR